MGLVTTKFISNFKKKEATQTLSLLGKKYASVINANEVNKLIEKEPAFSIKLQPEQKKIAGYNCKKAHIDFASDSLDDFDVFYTDEIAIADPNWSSPFRKINGVLMEFRIHKYGVDMVLKAKNVTRKEIDDSQFEISDDYKKISMNEMDKMFSDME
jgi:GLPGLI family protein